MDIDWLRDLQKPPLNINDYMEAFLENPYNWHNFPIEIQNEFICRTSFDIPGQITVKHKQCTKKQILKEYPQAVIIDVTSKGDMIKLSPFYPHGDIPIPFSGTLTAESVEGIWQGLKVFENENIDQSCFYNKTMKNLKRTCKTHGKCLGHRAGVYSDIILGYIEARKLIYIPSYNWVLKNKCSKEIFKLRDLVMHGNVVLLDYNTNEDIENISKPLSHASLIKNYVIELMKRVNNH